MQSIAFSISFRDFKGNSGSHFSFRGFSTLDAGSGEGFGRSFFHEDIKKEKRTITIQAAPKSIDELVLPFFVSKNRGIENAVYASIPSTPKSALPQIAQDYGQLLSTAPFAPSFAFDVRTALLLYARSEGEYFSMNAQPYAQVATTPVEITATPSRYAASNAYSLIFAPSTTKRTTEYRAEPKTLHYAHSLPLQPRIAIAPVMPKVPITAYVPSQPANAKLFIEKAIEYQRSAAPIVPAQVPLNAPRQRAVAYPLAVVEPRTFFVPSAKIEKHSVVQPYNRPTASPAYLKRALPKKTSVPMMIRNAHSDISLLFEPKIIVQTTKQPRTLEKIKRELPTYERMSAPTELEELASGIESKYGCSVSFKLTTGDQTYGRKDEAIIPPASVSKLGIVYAAMKLAKEGKLNLEERIDVKGILQHNPSLLPKNVGTLDDSYTWKDLLTEMVNDSNRGSNRNANIALFLLGKDKVNELLKENGYTNTLFSTNAPFTPTGGYHTNTTTLHEATALMQEFGDSSKWGAHYDALQTILSPSKNWAPFLFGPDSNGITLKRLKHGQTENAMSVIYEAEGADGRTYTGILSISNLQGRLVQEDYRKATELGKQVVMDFVKLSRALYQDIKRQEAIRN